MRDKLCTCYGRHARSCLHKSAERPFSAAVFLSIGNSFNKSSVDFSCVVKVVTVQLTQTKDRSFESLTEVQTTTLHPSGVGGGHLEDKKNVSKLICVETKTAAAHLLKPPTWEG